MRYNAHTYARALIEALGSKGEGSDEKAKRFVSLLKKNGDLKNLKKILEEAERISLKKSGARKVVIESARSLEDKAFRELQSGFKTEDVVESKINKELIAGVKITIDGEWTIDASLKGRLKKLFSEKVSK